MTHASDAAELMQLLLHALDMGLCAQMSSLWLLSIAHMHTTQVQGKDRALVADTARQLGMEGCYIPRSYIEQVRSPHSRPLQGCAQALAT